MLTFICASLERPRHCTVWGVVVAFLRPIGLVPEKQSNEREALQLPLKEVIFSVTIEGKEFGLEYL